MCRRDRCLGIWMLAFGMGLLTCSWIESHFWQIFLGVVISAGGILVLVKK